MLLCLFTKKKTSSVFPPSLMPLSTMPSSCAVMYHEWDTLLNVSRSDTFDFSQGHVTKNQPMAVPV